jgi:hypothetical protein
MRCEAADTAMAEALISIALLAFLDQREDGMRGVIQ